MEEQAKGIEIAIAKRQELEAAFNGLRGRIEKMKQAGVYFVDDSQVILSAETTIGTDTVVYPNVILEGKCSIGRGVILYPGCRLVDATIGDGTTVESSVILESSVGQDSTVGPFAYIRPGSAIGDKVKIGDFVEVKKSSIGHGTKVSHLTYLGDAVIGKGVNFGCGTVIVNYDGKVKNQTVVGDHAFIGCNTNLVSPVKVGKNAYTAAGSTITQDVPDYALAIGRVRQEIKENWVEKKGLKKEDKKDRE